jgi:glycerophosphoryl diester phosphodiesterase
MVSTMAMQLVGHAGLAIQRPGGAPSHRQLDEALDLGVDRLELDVCCSADGRLVMRHDACLDDGRLVGDLTLGELRAADPSLLTLDDVVEHLDGDLPLLLDLKMAHSAQALGTWFRGRRDRAMFAVCTENLPWLVHLRFAAPRVERWPSFPDLGERSRLHVQRVIAGLVRSHTSVGGLRRGAADVHRAIRQLRHRPHESVARLAGLPWRDRLPLDLAVPCADAGAAGICVQHWLVSERLVDEAHRAGLSVNTWTINSPAAALAAAACGVDSMTTDRVEAVRFAVRSPRETSPQPSGRSFRVVAGSGPS